MGKKQLLICSTKFGPNMSRYDADDVYCIPGTAVLKNKAGITDQDLLDEYEGDFTAIRLLELTQDPVEGFFDLAHLCKIHQYLFWMSTIGRVKSGAWTSSGETVGFAMCAKSSLTRTPFSVPWLQKIFARIGAQSFCQQVGPLLVRDQCDPCFSRRQWSSTTTFHFTSS